jgi:calcineurin-like phosphoesterase family protein
MNYWFTADHHFDHKMVIEYANRPFKTQEGKPDVELMNETMISNHNEVVAPNDHVYFLGDLGLTTTPERIYDYIKRMNGVKFWVPGNHDMTLRKSGRLMMLFEWCRDITEIQIPDPTLPSKHKRQSIVLCHYAMRVWNKSHHGSWQLYGHSHGSLKDDPHIRQIDVGVDCWDYFPAAYDEIKLEMAKKDWQPVDHHRARENGTI